MSQPRKPLLGPIPPVCIYPTSENYFTEAVHIVFSAEISLFHKC